MTITVLLVLFAAVALLLFIVRGLSASYRTTDEAELIRSIRPVDMEAFQNLIDPAEDEFLRNRLPQKEFQSIRRERARAALEYLGGVSHNAGILLQLGHAARSSPETQVAQSGKELEQEASRLRLYTTLARCKLCVRFVFPEVSLQIPGLVARYQQVTEEAVQLKRLRYPGRAALVSRPQ
jgi:hypothetical protein